MNMKILQGVWKNFSWSTLLDVYKRQIQYLLKGIYTHNGLLYFHTEIRNQSNVPFDVEMCIRDRWYATFE